MGWIDNLRGWVGLEKFAQQQDNINDPRLHDGVSNEAQFGAPDADRLERANPSVPEDMPFEDTSHDRPERDPRNIELVETSGWQGFDGLWESRTDLGKSEEGWHYNVEVSYQGGDGSETGWSKAYPDKDAAMEALHVKHNETMEPHEKEAEEREDREIDSFIKEQVEKAKQKDRSEGLEL